MWCLAFQGSTVTVHWTSSCGKKKKKRLPKKLQSVCLYTHRHTHIYIKEKYFNLLRISNFSTGRDTKKTKNLQISCDTIPVALIFYTLRQYWWEFASYDCLPAKKAIHFLFCPALNTLTHTCFHTGGVLVAFLMLTVAHYSSFKIPFH